jgi:hypothetical protein
MANKTVEFYGEKHCESAHAILVFDAQNILWEHEEQTDDNDRIQNVWIPKSQIIDHTHIKGADYEFVVTEWIAKQKGII